MEELKAMFRVCVHIKSNGIRCNSPALTGTNFCYQHLGGSVSALARARSTHSSAKLDFVYPADRQAIQHNLFLIAQALSEGKIDTQAANTYNRIFRTCELNLHRWEKRNPDGGPLKPAVGLSGEQEPTTPETQSASPQSTTTEDAPSFRAASSRERVGEHEPQLPSPNETKPELTELEAQYFSSPDGAPLNPAPGLSGEQVSHQDTETAAQEAHRLKSVDTFLQIDKMYQCDEDYAERIRAAIEASLNPESTASAHF